ncbi:type IV pilus modification protein PilV [Collimonas fungivorans]|nr:type IV pilus modification protein PilV [Collimonas fungivorans]
MVPAGNHAVRQSGTGMIEVLVAIVIAAFAMFALIGMQTLALHYQKSAHVHSMSSQFSADLADRVRANIRGADSGAYNLSQQTYPAVEESAPSCSESVGCTPQELAAKDIQEWRVSLANAVPGGWGEIAGSLADGFTVKVYFLDPPATGGEPDAVAKNCLPSAADPALHKDVMCIATAFFP